MSLQEALETLSAAHGPKALAAAFIALRSHVTASRKASKKHLGVLAQTYVEAMRIWDTQKADGVSKAERETGLMKTLKAAWPQTREWHYICASCADYGLVMSDCPGDATCGRSYPHLPHEFSKPCWCSRGQRFRPPPAPEGGDFRQAGKRARTFTRVGR